MSLAIQKLQTVMMYNLILFMDICFRDFKKNPDVSALIIVNPEDFDDQRVVKWTKNDSTKQASSMTNTDQYISEFLPGEEVDEDQTENDSKQIQIIRQHNQN